MDEITGKKIVAVRKLTAKEMQNEGWDTSSEAMCLVLEGGALIYASRDDEGNGPGSLFGQQKGQTYTIWMK